MNEQTDRSAASLSNLADPRLADVDRWVFLVDPDEVRARSHYLRLAWDCASFRRRRWRLPRYGHIVAYAELHDNARNVSPSTFLRPVLWLRTSPPDPMADPYDESYWPSEGVSLEHVLLGWSAVSTGGER
jgi:hypothetical protein